MIDENDATPPETTRFTLSDKNHERFTELLDEPPRALPGLAALAAAPSPFTGAWAREPRPDGMTNIAHSPFNEDWPLTPIAYHVEVRVTWPQAALPDEDALDEITQRFEDDLLVDAILTLSDPLKFLVKHMPAAHLAAALDTVLASVRVGLGGHAADVVNVSTTARVALD